MHEHAIIEQIIRVDRFNIPPTKYKLNYATPGHMIHLFEKVNGRYRVAGRDYEPHPGDLLRYCEAEEIEIFNRDEHCIFFAVQFLAPEMPLPSHSSRMLHSTQQIRICFKELHRVFCLPPTILRRLLLLGTLYNLLALIEKEAEKCKSTPRVASKWWMIEHQVRCKRLFKASLDQLANMGHCSRTSVFRICRKATGMSPNQRLKHICMEEGYGLLSLSEMNVSQVADYLGYSSVHGFSRDFAKHFGKPPTRMPPNSYRGITNVGARPDCGDDVRDSCGSARGDYGYADGLASRYSSSC